MNEVMKIIFLVGLGRGMGIDWDKGYWFPSEKLHCEAKFKNHEYKEEVNTVSDIGFQGKLKLIQLTKWFAPTSNRQGK